MNCIAIAQWIQQKFLFSNCISLIDGTLNPFTYEPQMEDAVDYSRCKYGYSLSTFVCVTTCTASHIMLLVGLAVHMATENSTTATYSKPYKLFHPSAVPTW